MASLKSSAFGVGEGKLAMYDGLAALIDHGACIEGKDKASFDHLSMHEANHPPSGQPPEGGHEGLLKPNQAHFQNVPQVLLPSRIGLQSRAPSPGTGPRPQKAPQSWKVP